jgi:3'(2'), 5'-bisphosphate nucleotidase
MPEAAPGRHFDPAALSRLLARAADAAREAGAAILEVYERPFTVTCKQDDSPVTAADLASHRIIAAALGGGPGDLPLLSEEGRAVSWAERKRWPAYWLVDPLDGTREFVARNDEFTVNIALIEAGRPILGLIYAPVFALLYAGARGLGAWKIPEPAPRAKTGKPSSWEALAARGRPLPAGRLGGPTRLVGSRSHQSEAFRSFADRLRQSDPELELFVCGSALKFGYLAEGRASVYAGFGKTKEWDTAAGQAIVNQVGIEVRALVRGRPGEELVYNRRDLCTGPFIARRN